jgi:hypothetical protein
MLNLADGVEHSRNRTPHKATEMMEIENLFRYTALAVGLKPSANQGKARLRGLYRIIYSKTIISVYTQRAAGASRDTADRNNGQCI